MMDDEHPRDPLGALPPSRHPFQVLLMLALVVLGLSALLLSPPGSVNALLPDFGRYLWAGVTLIGGGGTVVAAALKDRATGLLLERITLGLVAVGAPVYGLAVLRLSDAGTTQASGLLAWILGQSLPGWVNGIPACAVFIGIGVAAVWRIVHAGRELERLKEYLELHHISDEDVRKRREQRGQQ